MTSSTIPTTDISSPIVANEKTGKYKHKNEVHGSSMKRDSKKKKSKVTNMNMFICMIYSNIHLCVYHWVFKVIQQLDFHTANFILKRYF